MYLMKEPKRKDNMSKQYEMSYECNGFCHIITCDTNEQVLTEMEKLYQQNNEEFVRENFDGIIGHRFLSDDCVNIPRVLFR